MDWYCLHWTFRKAVADCFSPSELSASHSNSPMSAMVVGLMVRLPSSDTHDLCRISGNSVMGILSLYHLMIVVGSFLTQVNSASEPSIIVLLIGGIANKFPPISSE